MAQIVDIQAIVADYLRPITGTRVVAFPPAETETSWVLVTLISAPQDADSPVDHLVAFSMQFDCYAGAQPETKPGMPEASDLGRVVREALTEMDQADHDDAEVTACRISNDFTLLDTDLKPARARRVITATIWAHALEPIS